jgi:hypothetical protein
MQRAIKNIEDLIHFIEKLFGVDLSKLDVKRYDNRLPKCLRYLYAIEDFFTSYDCKFEIIRFFNNQFHLIPYGSLKLENESFDIVFENQNNWRVAYHKNENAIYLSEHFELPYNTRLNNTLDEFLISFALHEVIFNCNHFCELPYKEINELKTKIKLHPLWNGKTMTDYAINFYTTEKKVLVIDGGWIVMGTNDETVYNEHLKILN